MTDLASIGSLLVGATLGLAKLGQDIRTHFHMNFVRAYNEHGSSFQPIIDKYSGENGVFAKLKEYYEVDKEPWIKKANEGDKEALGKVRQYAKQYRAEIKTEAQNFRTDIAKQLEVEHNIPTSGIKGWTVGTLKRFNELGTTAKIQSSLGFFTIAASAIGAAIVLQHNAHRTDRVGSKVDDLREDFEKKEAGNSR